MSHKTLKIIGLSALFVLCASAASAQDTGNAPKPAMTGGSATGLESDTPPDIADTRPLAGVQNLSLGSRSSHSFLLPSFGVTSALQFNGYDTSAGTSSPQSTTYLSGRLGVNKISSRSELMVDYLAAGGFSSDSNQGNSVIQSLDFAETIRGGRWSQTFGEAFSYLPSSSFNFGGMGGLNNLGVSLGAAGTTPGFRQDLIPNESILTNGSARINSATMVQTGYALGYRSSLSVFGSYGTLHFLNGGLQDNSNVTAGVGYNYLLSPLNSMSISYGFSTLMLPNLPRGPDSHSVLMSFGRRMTGRLSFQIGAGPDIQVFQSPLAGSGTVLSWTLNSALNYQIRSWGTGLNYSHSLTGGSGVLPGAETDQFSGHAGRKLGSWQTSLGLGYSRNHALQQTSATTFAPQAWFAGGGISRGFGTFGSLDISYNASRESSLGAICALPVCNTSGLSQTVSIGYSWGFRPIVLE
jgi:hypothetical protein